MKHTLNIITSALIGASALASSAAYADDFITPKLDFRLRFESSDRDNALSTGSGLTLRTTLSAKSKEVNGWSGFVEFEDVRKVGGIDNYNDIVGSNRSEFNVIADPETTEWDQGYIQYKTDTLTARVGRQMITLDDHRFVGSVIWRQDKQTYDAASVNFTPSKDFKVYAAYLTQRNRIFAESRDQESKDFILNASYKTPIGQLTGYSYLLELDNGTDNALDTYGFFFKGAKPAGDVKVHYHAEFATQTNETGGQEFDTTFYRFEGGATISGITAKIGLESLGSDNGQIGFATPLATLHKFNGWTDQFLGTPAEGLDDLYIQAAGSAFGGKWLIRYHDYSANEASETIDDLGSEIEGQFTKKFKSGVYSGVKFAVYSEGDRAANVDETVFWAWVGKTF